MNERQPTAAEQKAKALSRWENEGGAIVPYRAEDRRESERCGPLGGREAAPGRVTLRP